MRIIWRPSGCCLKKSGTAQVRDIARMLKVKMPSVTSAVKQLADMGLVEYTQYAPVKLTPQGRRIAGKIIVSHGILFDFLREELALPEERANEVACQIEHIMTFEEIEKLKSCRIRPFEGRGRFCRIGFSSGGGRDLDQASIALWVPAIREGRDTSV